MSLKHSLFAITFCLIPYRNDAASINQQTPECLDAVYADNTPLRLSKFKGKVVLLDFWATWCPPCKKSIPFLNAMRDELANQGFEIVAINVDENLDDAKEFLAENPIGYVSTFDPSGKCPGIYGVEAMPSSYLIDKSGTIREIHMGFRDEDRTKLKLGISRLLTE